MKLNPLMVYFFLTAKSTKVLRNPEASGRKALLEKNLCLLSRKGTKSQSSFFLFLASFVLPYSNNHTLQILNRICFFNFLVDSPS